MRGYQRSRLSPRMQRKFPLVANVYADGSVSGQYTDQFGHGNGGFHAVIDCVSIVGNIAWVSGVIKQGNLGTTDLAGVPVVTRVQDNGTSANDPPDRISYSWFTAIPCTNHVAWQLLDAPEGQVKVDLATLRSRKTKSCQRPSPQRPGADCMLLYKRLNSPKFFSDGFQG